MGTISGQFVGRPNRFIVRCDVDSQRVEAFMAKPGKMWDLLLPGAELRLEPTPSAKQPYRVVAVAVDYDHNLKSINVRPLEIPWSIVEKEGHDRGCYWLWLHLDETHQVEVGALGTIAFPAGSYLYAGSARRGLDARLARHLRLRKRHHWHIDYLRGVAHKCRAIPIRTSDDLTCQLAEELCRLGGRGIPRFGCSDCSCPSHLYHFASDPLMDRAFQETLLHLRMGRLL